MLAYCHDLKTCRRTLTGRHFSEQWKSDECHEMCDNCRRTGDQSDGSRVPFVQREITNYCKDILLILERASSLSERVTANKLVDLWCGKGKPNLRVRDVKTPDLSREDCERVIVDMLLEGVLREDFHFTPYSTISYLLPGPKAGLIHSGKRLYMDFRDDSDSKSTPKKAKKRQSNRPSHSKTSNASKSKMAKTDGELVRNPSETTVENDDDENDSVSCAKRMKPSKQLFIDDSDDDDTSEIVVLD